jgi:hypothetical protein
MIPPTELNAFLKDEICAICSALAGDLTEGYDRLLAGLHRGYQAWYEGQFWASALIRRYRRALVEYELRYGAHLD